MKVKQFQGSTFGNGKIFDVIADFCQQLPEKDSLKISRLMFTSKSKFKAVSQIKHSKYLTNLIREDIVKQILNSSYELKIKTHLVNAVFAMSRGVGQNEMEA